MQPCYNDLDPPTRIKGGMSRIYLTPKTYIFGYWQGEGRPFSPATYLKHYILIGPLRSDEDGKWFPSQRNRIFLHHAEYFVYRLLIVYDTFIHAVCTYMAIVKAILALLLTGSESLHFHPKWSPQWTWSGRFSVEKVIVITFLSPITS